MSVSGRLTPELSADYAGVVPLGDLLQVDVCQDIGSELELAVLDAGQVEDHGDGADRHRDVEYGPAGGLGRGRLLVVHDAVAGPEVHCLSSDLLDAAPGADGLVVDLDLALLAELIDPLGVEGKGKGGAGARE